MGYIVKLNEKEWKQIKKQERYVLFLKDKVDFNILKKSVLYFHVENKTKENEIFGEACIEDVFSFSDFKLDKDNVQLLDTRNLAMSESQDISSSIFMNALSKGFENRANHLKLFKDKKDNAFFHYAVELGFAKDFDSAKKFDVNWSCAIVFDKVDIYESRTPLEFFGNLGIAKEHFIPIAKKCFHDTGFRCYQCPYVATCLNQNIPIHKYPMLRIDKEIEETLFIRPKT